MTDWPWPHFSRAEMTCRCGCGRADMDPAFMHRIERLREAFGAAMPVTSGFRCAKHNAAVSTTGADGPHTTGKAADISVRGSDAYRLLRQALAQGFTGVGVSQNGANRFLHLDTLDVGRPSLWSY